MPGSIGKSVQFCEVVSEIKNVTNSGFYTKAVCEQQQSEPYGERHMYVVLRFCNLGTLPSIGKICNLRGGIERNSKYCRLFRFAMYTQLLVKMSFALVSRSNIETVSIEDV